MWFTFILFDLNLFFPFALLWYLSYLKYECGTAFKMTTMPGTNYKRAHNYTPLLSRSSHRMRNNGENQYFLTDAFQMLWREKFRNFPFGKWNDDERWTFEGLQRNKTRKYECWREKIEHFSSWKKWFSSQERRWKQLLIRQSGNISRARCFIPISTRLFAAFSYFSSSSSQNSGDLSDQKSHIYTHIHHFGSIIFARSNTQIVIAFHIFLISCQKHTPFCTLFSFWANTFSLDGRISRHFRDYIMYIVM